MAIRFNATSSPPVIALYTVPSIASTDDAPMTDPFGELDRVSFHSGIGYIAVVRTFTKVITIPANDPDRKQVFTLGSHLQSGRPYIKAFARGRADDGGALPLVGTVPLYVSADKNLITVTMGVNATSVLAYVQRSYPTMGSVNGIPITIDVHVTNEILE